MPKVAQMPEKPQVMPVANREFALAGQFPLAIAGEGQVDLALQAEHVLARPAHTMVPAAESVALVQVAPKLIAQRKAEEARHRAEEAKRRAAEARRAAKARAAAVYKCE